jgi:hypothetical protein
VQMSDRAEGYIFVGNSLVINKNVVYLRRVVCPIPLLGQLPLPTKESVVLNFHGRQL